MRHDGIGLTHIDGRRFAWVGFVVALLVCRSHPVYAGEPSSVSFEKRVADRALIDLYQNRHYSVESDREPVPETAPSTFSPSGDRIRVVRPRLRDSAVRYRSQFSNSLAVLPGYRAAILDQATERPPFRLVPAILTESQREAANWIDKHLASDGLLATLARVLEILGPTNLTHATTAPLDVLRPLGFPVDLLATFAPDATLPAAERPVAVLHQVAQWLATHPAQSPELKEKLRQLPFRFAPSRPGFQISTESGTESISWIRMQAGGGYRNGIVPGGSIDVIARLVAALPHVDFLINVPVEIFEPFARLASGWPLTRPQQIALVQEAFMVSAWAQDNGKAGTLPPALTQPGGAAETHRFAKSATLVPRFASIDEGRSLFAPGESFLVDGLRAAGHPVFQSSLLFQGGNLLAIQHPRTGRRFLLIGDGELRRNEYLGLNESQILEAFRIEFGVDECIVIPGCSYHLDFDLSIRAHGDTFAVLVNDSMDAARLMAVLGIEALEKHGELSPADATSIIQALRQRRDRHALENLERAAPELRPAEPADGTPTPAIGKRWSRCFAPTPIDSAAGNLQCFLLALDLLELEAWDSPGRASTRSPQRGAYLEAIRRSEGLRRQQIATVEKLGWKTVPIPSTQDLHRGINYLNGIHFPEGFVMPAFGGFYQSLDAAATQALRRAFGPDFQVIPILCAESQRKYGGIHCVTAVYPADSSHTRR